MSDFTIGGIKASDLAEKYGTPLYVYDAEKIAAQYDRLKKAYSDTSDLKINYACKANTNINILRLMERLGTGIDAVSVNEVKLALKAGFSPDRIIFTPSGIGMDEIAEAVSIGVRINLDNLNVLAEFGKRYPDYSVGLRITPGVMAGGHAKISVGHKDSKFGISPEQLPEIVGTMKKYNIRINGLHMHAGSDIKDVNLFLEAAEPLFALAVNFDYLDYLDFGSGFKVAYRSGDVVTDVELAGKKLTERFNEFQEKYRRPLSLIIEPGKFLVSEAGYFLVRVNSVKQTPNALFAQVDSGQNHLIRPMFYDAYHHIENVSNPDGPYRIYNVTGYICETDNFAVGRNLPEVRQGDLLAMRNAGAYGFSMSSNYNSRVRPSEVMVKGGKDYLIRQRETLDDLLRNQIEVNF